MVQDQFAFLEAAREFLALAQEILDALRRLPARTIGADPASLLRTLFDEHLRRFREIEAAHRHSFHRSLAEDVSQYSEILVRGILPLRSILTLWDSGDRAINADTRIVAHRLPRLERELAERVEELSKAIATFERLGVIRTGKAKRQTGAAREKTAQKVTASEANLQASALLRGRPPNGKESWTLRALAMKIGCSPTLVARTAAWQDRTQEKKKSASNRQSNSSRVRQSRRSLQEIAQFRADERSINPAERAIANESDRQNEENEQDRDNELQRLIKEQQDDQNSTRG